MGFNSILFIPNDHLDMMERNAEAFTREVRRACGSLGNGPLPGTFSNFSVPYIAHADDVGLVAVGGNYAETIYQGRKGWSHDHHTPEGQVDLLKRLAKSMGYSVRKNPEKK